MGFLTRGAGLPDHSKAIYSLWFRVPQASIDAAKADYDATVFVPPFILPGIIPLMTFGRQQTFKTYGGDLVDINIWEDLPPDPEIPADIRIPFPTLSRTDPVSPSYIGLDCSSGSMKLAFNLQTGVSARAEGQPGRIIEKHIWQNGLHEDGWTPPGFVPIGPGELSPAPGSGWVATTFYVFDDTWYPVQPEKFYVKPLFATLAADQWHHLLLSYDFSADISAHSSPTFNTPFDTVAQGTTSSGFLWYSIDDVNKNGIDDLTPFGVDGGAANAILTEAAYNCANDCLNLGEGNRYYGDTTCSFTPGPLPSSGAAFGIPSSSGYQGHIYDVDMGEGQIFFGISLDTAVEANRRLFVTLDGKPEPMATAAQALGQEPHIKLHSQKNWLAGKNTGSLGGVLTRTSTVLPFLPSPGLGT